MKENFNRFFENFKKKKKKKNSAKINSIQFSIYTAVHLIINLERTKKEINQTKFTKNDLLS
jgi:transcriptional regulator of met regulon